MERREFISRRPSDTWAIGELIGRIAKRGELYAIYGELGTGKTQLVKGIAKGMGVDDWEYVLSPSFTIMNRYDGKEYPLWHIDLYRIEADEIEDFQIEELLEEGVVVVEWAERRDWGKWVIRVEINVIEDDERRIVIERPQFQIVH